MMRGAIPSLLLHQSRVPRPRVLVPLHSTYSTEKKKPFFKRVFGGKDKDGEGDEEPEADRLLEEVQANLEIEQEEQKRLLRRNRNKSRLRASDRKRLYGMPPLEGVAWERNDWQRGTEFKVRDNSTTWMATMIC